MMSATNAARVRAVVSERGSVEGFHFALRANDKESARLIVAAIILDVFNQLKVTCPETSDERRLELQQTPERLLT